MQKMIQFNGVASTKIGGDKIFDFRRKTILFMLPPLNAQNYYIFQTLVVRIDLLAPWLHL